MTFSIQRISDGQVVTRMDDLDLETTKGIVQILWGVIPDTLETGGDPEEEWKLHIGGVHWVIVARTA